MDVRGFLEQFSESNIGDDPLPIKVLRNAIAFEDIPGQAVFWGFEYLDQRACPTQYIYRILQKLLEEMPNTDFEGCVEKDVSMGESAEPGIRYEPLKLMRAVVKKVDEICVREREDLEDSVDGTIETPDMLPNVYAISYHNIKNSRRYMEDRITMLPRMDRIYGLKEPISYFAVFDGHNGAEAAEFGAAQLHNYLIQSMRQQEDPIQCISDAFESLDENFVNKCRACKVKSGSTAVLVLIMAGKLYIAWVGDSQAVLAKKNEINNLVTPHKPERADEVERIRSLGGDVLNLNGTCRVNGNLAVSRAIGDADDKKFIIATPDIKMMELDGSEEFLVLACDGIWDEVSPEGAVQIVRRQIVTDSENVQGISRRLVQQAKMKGSSDNISVIVVMMEPIESIKSRYEGILESEPETDFGTLKPTLDTILLPPTDGSTDFESHVPSIVGMNGHNQETTSLADILQLNEASGIETGGEVLADDIDGWDKLKRSDDDVDEDKDVEELSDAEPDDEWQFEKPAELIPSQLILDSGALLNEDVNPIQLEEGLDIQVNAATENDPLLNNFVEESQGAHLVDEIESVSTQFNGLSVDLPATSGHLDDEIIALVGERPLEPSTESLNPFTSEVKLEETNLMGKETKGDSTLFVDSCLFGPTNDEEPRLDNLSSTSLVADSSLDFLNPFTSTITPTLSGVEESVVFSLDKPELMAEGTPFDFEMSTQPQVNPFDINEVSTDTQSNQEGLEKAFPKENPIEGHVDDCVQPDILPEDPTENLPSHEEAANYETRDILVDIGSTNPFVEENLLPSSEIGLATGIKTAFGMEAGIDVHDKKPDQLDIQTIHFNTASISNAASESEIQELTDFVEPTGNQTTNDEEAHVHEASGSLDIPHDVTTAIQQPIPYEPTSGRVDSVEILLPPRDLGAASVSPDMSRELFGEIQTINLISPRDETSEDDITNISMSSITTRSEIMDLPSNINNVASTEEGSVIFDIRLSTPGVSKGPENSDSVESVAETQQVNIDPLVAEHVTDEANAIQFTKPAEAEKPEGAEEEELIITEVYDEEEKKMPPKDVKDVNIVEVILDTSSKPITEEIPVFNGQDSPDENVAAVINNKDSSDSSEVNANANSNNVESLPLEMAIDRAPDTKEPEIIEVIQEPKASVENKAVPKTKTPASPKDAAAPKPRASLTSATGVKKSPVKTADQQAKSPSPNSKSVAQKASPSKPAGTAPKAPVPKAPATTSSIKPAVGRVAPVVSSTTRVAPSRSKDADPKIASKSSTSTSAALKSAILRTQAVPFSKPALPKTTTSPKRIPATTAPKPAGARAPASGVGTTKVGEDAKINATASTLAKSRPKPATGLAPRPAAKVENKPLGSESKKPATTGSTTKVGGTGTGATKPITKPLVSRSAPTSSRTAPPPKMAPSKPMSARAAPKADDKPIAKPAPKLTSAAKVPSAPKKIESTLKSKKPAPTAISKGGVQTAKMLKTKPEEKSVELLEQNGVSNGTNEAADPPMNITNGVNGHHETENGEIHQENGVHDVVDLLTEQN